MPSIGATRPPHTEWVNGDGEECASRCVPGYATPHPDDDPAEGGCIPLAEAQAQQGQGQGESPLTCGECFASGGFYNGTACLFDPHPDPSAPPPDLREAFTACSPLPSPTTGESASASDYCSFEVEVTSGSAQSLPPSSVGVVVSLVSSGSAGPVVVPKGTLCQWNVTADLLPPAAAAQLMQSQLLFFQLKELQQEQEEASQTGEGHQI